MLIYVGDDPALLRSGMEWNGMGWDGMGWDVMSCHAMSCHDLFVCLYV